MGKIGKAQPLTQVELAALLEQRKQVDPLWWFCVKPLATTAQLEILNDQDHPYIAITSGNRGGKSATMAASIAMALRNLDMNYQRVRRSRPIHLSLLAPSLGQIAEIWGQKLLLDCELNGPEVPASIKGRGFLPAEDIKRVGYEHASGKRCPAHITMKNGNTLSLVSVADIHQWRRVQGAKKDGIFIDEGACTVELLNELLLRLVDAQSDLRRSGEVGIRCGIMWAATLTDAHMYAGYEKFLNACREGDVGHTGQHKVYTLIQADNPALDAQVIMEMERVIGKEEADVRMRGKSRVGDFLVYPQFVPEEHVLTKDFMPSNQASIWLGYDPGVNHPTGLQFSVFEPDEPFVMKVWRYIEYRGQTVIFDAKRIREILDGRPLECLVTDPSAGNTNKQGTSVRLQLFEELRKVGVQPLQGMRSNFGTAINDMVKSIQAVRARFEQKRILVSPECTTWISQHLKWRFKPGTLFKGMGTPYDKEDESCDTTRYLTMAQAQWIKRTPLERVESVVAVAPVSEDPRALDRQAAGRRVYERAMRRSGQTDNVMIPW